MEQLNNRLYISCNETLNNKSVINKFKTYLSEEEDKATQIYIITAPLGGKYTYDYEENALVLLIPKHKIIFLNLSDKRSPDFENYYEDFIEDLASISDKYEYKGYIGRPRDWKENNTAKANLEDFNKGSLKEFLTSFELKDSKEQRIGEYLISLLIGSINDIQQKGIEVPETLLEKVKKNIVLFDGDQTRFIYRDFSNKIVTIQGLSGTGKTELLLHKLKDIYLKEKNSKIFFTCHSVALANTLKERVPSFFNFMKVDEQIEWEKRLWVSRAWGSQKDINSGLYSYICNFYNIPFLGFGYNVDYNKIFSEALDFLNNIPSEDFEYAFDYILVDERQDFPEVFFKVCEKVAKEKVFIAGDVFQDIFENLDKKQLEVDIILNKCYRTDPRTLMFAHSVGLGLFEKDKFNWFDDEGWRAFGYILERDNNELHLTREPIRRFEDVNTDNFESVEIVKSTHANEIISIIKKIIDKDKNTKPDDISIILLDDNKKIYQYIDTLSNNINTTFNWTVNRGYETKQKIENTLYISNPNNIKGLEFPYVICVTGGIQNTYKYRNILYTMLTRSFIQSYLLLNPTENLEEIEKGLSIINDKKYIRTVEPTEEEKEKIQSNLIQFKNKPSLSYEDFLNGIFNDLNIPEESRKLIKNILKDSKIERFDREKTISFVKANKDFY
ncbi:ATP-binding domain-containing protein [Capnocytophaga sputigena]|uniref:DEAD/DEAH box helicase n=1 Tax=Capnocytophaga sputigena TaxID=1019 RepID=UPI00288B2A3D|nr:ATP-binding domain-containing protein [Capnocytophaga sputigena]